MLFYKVFKGSAKVILNLIYRIDINGIENMPKEGRVVVCANHFHWVDPLILAVVLPRKINYMAKEELFSNKLLGSVLRKLGVIPVSRGSADIGAIKAALRILKNDELFGIFPEGTRSKQGEELDAKPGLAMIAIKAQSPVLPVAIVGNYKLFSRVKINIDKPVDLSDYFGQKIPTEEYQKLSQNILDKIKTLSN